MKHNRMLLIFLLTFAACSDPEEVIRQKQEKEKQESLPPQYTVIEIDGCEYFRSYSTHNYVHITHNGNFKNPVHCTNNKTYGTEQDQG